MRSITVTSIRQPTPDAVSVGVEIISGENRRSESFLLLSEFFERLGIEVGELSGDGLCDVEFWSNVTEAYMSACRSFAFTPSSLSALRAKLISKGFERNVAGQAIEHLRSRGFVDEEEIALRRAEIFVSKLWGQTRIMAKLREEGFDDSVTDAVCNYLEDVDMVALCASLIEKKYGTVPSDRREREKMCGALYRYGYSPSEIKLAMLSISDE